MEYEELVRLIRDLEDIAKVKMEEVLPSDVSIEDFQGGVDFWEAENTIVRGLEIETGKEGYFKHGRAWFIDTSYLPNARQDLQIIFLWKDLPIEGNFSDLDFEMMPDLKDLLDADPDASIFRDIEVRIVDNATADMYLRTGYGPNTYYGLLRDSKEPLFDLKVGDMSELQESKIFGSGSTIGEQIDEVLPMDYQPGKTTLNMPGPSGEVGSVSSAFTGDTPFVTQDVLDNMIDFEKAMESSGKPNTSTVDDLKLFKMIRDSEVEGIEGLEEIAGIHTETEISEEIAGVDIPDTPEGAAKDIVPDDVSGLDTPTNVVDKVPDTPESLFEFPDTVPQELVDEADMERFIEFNELQEMGDTMYYDAADRAESVMDNMSSQLSDSEGERLFELVESYDRNMSALTNNLRLGKIAKRRIINKAKLLMTRLLTPGMEYLDIYETGVFLLGGLIAAAPELKPMAEHYGSRMAHNMAKQYGVDLPLEEYTPDWENIALVLDQVESVSPTDLLIKKAAAVDTDTGYKSAYLPPLSNPQPIIDMNVSFKNTVSNYKNLNKYRNADMSDSWRDKMVESFKHGSTK